MDEAPAQPSVVVESGKSREEVAFLLLELIARSEGKDFGAKRGAPGYANVDWILDTYIECLAATKGERLRNEWTPQRRQAR